MAEEKQVETAAQVTLNVNGTEYRVKSIDTSVDVNVEIIHGNQLKPAGWGVTDVTFSGSLTFNGDVADVVVPELTQDDGITPREGNSITITHMDGGSTIFEDVFLDNMSYSMSEKEITETSFEFVAMDME